MIKKQWYQAPNKSEFCTCDQYDD